MPETPIKHYASTIDNMLNNARFQTLIHGDAKLANLCFHQNNQQVAAVDFQYVGRGAGVKDLAYLAASALDDDDLVKYSDWIVNEYIAHHLQALHDYRISIDYEQLVDEIHKLYPLAWADYYRFLLGWNNKSWKISRFMQRMADKGLQSMKKSQL